MAELIGGFMREAMRGKLVSDGYRPRILDGLISEDMAGLRCGLHRRLYSAIGYKIPTEALAAFFERSKSKPEAMSVTV